MRLRTRTAQILGAAILVLFACASAAAQSIHIPPHEKVTLKNGLTVLLLEKHGVPIVSFQAIVKTGAVADPEGQEGLAAVTAELLRKGTKSRSAQQFAADLDFIGGSFDSSAGSDFTTVSAEFLAKDLGRGLDLFFDGLLHPTFPQAEVEKILAQDVDEVRSAKDNPQQVLGRYFSGYLFGPRSYGRPESGDEISLKHINRDAIVKYYDSNYAPGNTLLAVAGEFNAAEMRKQLEEKLGGWAAKKAPAATIAAVAPAEGKRLLLVDKPDATQTYFAIGNVGTKANDPDRAALLVVNSIFGGRFTSLLNEALRVESGLTYGAGSRFDSRQQPGTFGIYSYTRNETTVAALDLALEVLRKFHKDGISPEQLAATKSYIKGQFPPSIETSAQLARLIARNEFYGLDDSEVNQLEARIDAVTPEIARQVIQKHFPENNLVFVLIGKASVIAPIVKKYAEKQDARPVSEPGFWPPPAGKK